MCVNYIPTPRRILASTFAVQPPEQDWRDEVWQDYQAPILIGHGGHRRALLASYGMVPKRHLPPKVRFSTMNARAETVGERKSYKQFWAAGQLCLVPMMGFYEPSWETGKAVRWRIGMADGSPFAVAGLWREWLEDDGRISYAFTQLTINADDHPLMQRFHKPGDEKRSLVIVPAADYDHYLSCRNPELARTFIRAYPAEGMASEAAPVVRTNTSANPFQLS